MLSTGSSPDGINAWSDNWQLLAIMGFAWTGWIHSTWSLETMLKTGFVGLGAMGLPMARNLHKAGLLSAVWNRTPGKASDLSRETGCLHCDGLEELATHCDVIVTCVSANQDLLTVAEGLATGVGPGDVVLDCSTVDSKTALAVDRILSHMGAGFLDCPVSGGTEGARLGTLSIMVGGDTDGLNRAAPVLEAMGRTIVHVGPVGAGQAAKATNQIMVAGINQAVTEALAFGQAHGLPMDRLIEALSEGAASNWFLSHRGPTMIKGEYPLGFKVMLHQKDLGICAGMAAQKGVKLPIVEMTRIHYRRLMEQGHGESDISSLFVLKEEMFSTVDG
jgi:3-hydroxyisobutyrate dehydrogenase